MESAVRKWYAGRSIFITGGTGFMGKVLLEKLLRSCPEIEEIYVLTRAKRGVSALERVRNFGNLPLFTVLREQNPKALLKLKGVEGDICSENLGLTPNDLKAICQKVSIVFHGAASLRLEAGMKHAIMQNTLGTKRVLELCLKMPKIEVVLHSSTAFCHVDVDVLEEKVYDPHHKPDELINLVHNLDEESLDLITPRLLGPHPNCYTFSKRLAETVICEMSDKLPTAIVRPAIVVPTLKDPLPGWVDSLNGPVGVLAAGGKGVIRSMLVDEKNNAEVIPVDVAINGTIVAAWHRGVNKYKTPPVFNMTQSAVMQITWGEVLEKGRNIIAKYPFEWTLWYPNGGITTNPFLHAMNVFLFQRIPAYLIDFLLLLAMQPRFLVRVQDKIKVGMEVLQYFTLRNWNFRSSIFLNLTKHLNETDQQIFFMANADYNIDEFITNAILGTRHYCLKENPKSIPRCRKNLFVLFVLDRFFKTAFFVLIFWGIYRLMQTFFFGFGGQDYVFTKTT